MLEDPMGYGDRGKGPETAILTLLFLFFSLLFISDSGADRIVKVLVDSGHYARDARTASPGFEAYSIYSSPAATFNYTVWDGLQYATFASVPMPSGLALSGSTVYAGSHSSGLVYAFSRASGILLSVVQAAPSGAQ